MPAANRPSATPRGISSEEQVNRIHHRAKSKRQEATQLRSGEARNEELEESIRIGFQANLRVGCVGSVLRGRCRRGTGRTRCAEPLWRWNLARVALVIHA